MIGWQHIRKGLIRANQIFLNRNVILNLEEDDWRGTDQRKGQQCPSTGELSQEGRLVTINAPNHSGTSGLDSLVEADVIRALAAGIAEGTHEPSADISLELTVLGYSKGELYQ